MGSSIVPNNNTIEAAYSVPLSNVTLWQPNSFGNPFGSVIWTANCLEDVGIKDSFEEKLSRPSGTRYPATHHVNESHFINLPGLMDFSMVMQRNQYFVMYIAWLQGDLGPYAPNPRWRDRTYFGVTYMDLAANGRGPEGGNEIHQRQNFRAQFYIANTGQGIPPGPVGLNVGN
jgi:hypothetical protein